jgi:hypothetical protein
MTNYFSVALTGTTQSWLMNLPEGSLTSWQELCRQFMVNFENASFIQRFSQVHNIIPHISNASVVVAFRQGVRGNQEARGTVPRAAEAAALRRRAFTPVRGQTEGRP